MRPGPAARNSSAAVRAEYESLAGGYDGRWDAYTRRTLDLLRPHLPAEPGRVLDVGCGTGALLRSLAEWRTPAVRYTGVDLAPAMVEEALHSGMQGGIPAAYAAASAAALPFPSGSFDTAVTASSLHYWPDVPGALAEIRRVLRPGGTLLVLDWCGDDLSVRLMVQWLRLTGRPVARVFRVAELAAEVARAGIRVTTVRRASAGWPWGMMVVEAVVAT